MIGHLALGVSQAQLVKICLAYGMQPERAKLFTATLIEECTKLNIDYFPVFVLAVAETNLKNVVGDNGKAVGYFQLHKEAVWFVKHRYGINVGRNHTDLLYNVELQIMIAVRYFHYLLTRYNSVEQAVIRWNGKEEYLHYYKAVENYIRSVFLR